MYTQQAHKKFNHHTIKDSQSVCRMIDRVNKKYGTNENFWNKQYIMSDDVIGFYPSLTHFAIYENSCKMLDRWEAESQEKYPSLIEKAKTKNVIIAQIKQEQHIRDLCFMTSYCSDGWVGNKNLKNYDVIKH